MGKDDPRSSPGFRPVAQGKCRRRFGLGDWNASDGPWGHFSAGPFDRATEFSSTTRQSECTRHAGRSDGEVAQRRSEIYHHCLTD